MSKFPLYDNIIKDISKKDLTIPQKKALIKRIQKIDNNGHELIYALIRMYQTENSDQEMSFTLPYNGLYVENNINFDLENLPVELRQMLLKFVDVHLAKMQEENVMIKKRI